MTPSKCCPEGWQFSPSVFRTGQQLGLSDADIALELDTMRDWEFRRAYTDWDKVARNWLRKEYKIRAAAQQSKFERSGGHDRGPESMSWGELRHIGRQAGTQPRQDESKAQFYARATGAGKRATAALPGLAGAIKGMGR